ncbi:integrase, catalytic region, zinc finger, CCHC-type containing protein [Tanacetum coccineum]
MDPIISLGQKNTLVVYMILSGADNRPPMLDKDLYDSWKSRMELYMQNREHERMILESVEHGPLIWHTIEENGVTRTKKYAELSTAKKIQADCDIKETNINLQGLPADIYSLLINDMNIYKMKMEQFQVNTKFLNSLPPEWSKFVTDVKAVKDLHTTNFDQLHAYLEQHELHENEVHLMRERNQDPLALFPPSQYGSIHLTQHYSSNYPSQPQFNHSSIPPSYPYQSQMNHHTSSVLQIAYQSPQVSTQSMTELPLVDSGLAVPVFSPRDDPIACLNKAMAFLTVVASLRFPSANNQLRTSSNLRNQATIQDGKFWGNNASGQTRVVKCYNCQGEGHMARNVLNLSDQGMQHDPGVPGGQAVQTIIPNNVAFQTKDVDTYDSDCDDISNAKAWPIFPTMVLTLSQRYPILKPISMIWKIKAQQDSMILFVVEQMLEQMINHVNNWEKANKEQNNESVTAELERYKERVKTFEQRLNIDLSSREKMIDSQMDDMIKEKLALKEQVDSLEQNLSKQIKENESLLQTFTVFKNESKEKENKYMENEIDLEKKIKELDNIIFKVGQSAQTVHMLTKPQVFYDNAHKQALGYQNPFYLKKAQRIKPTLYDGIVIYDKHVAMPVIDDEETLILEEESRSKMSEKEKDPETIKQKISHKPIDYVKLNQLSEDFRKRFVPQQELSAEQAFWYHMSNPSTEYSDASPIKMEAPKELPKVSLVNESLKKFKFHLAKFDNVVKIRTTPDAHTEGEWGFEHTKAVFNNEIIPFLKSLKDIFNVFDKDLLNEIIEVQTVFDQMEDVVQQSSVDKQCLEIAKKELLL